MKQCRGCGAVLQSDNPKELGYIPKTLLEDIGKALVCQRCFRLTKYGKDELGPITKREAYDAVKIGVSGAEAVLLVVDLLDFDACIPDEMISLIKDKPLVVVANKGDLLPPKTTIDETEKWVSDALKEKGLKKSTVLVISAIKYHRIDELSQLLTSYRLKNWVVIGVTNVGKSTLIEKLLKREQRIGAGLPTISRVPGTTVEKLSWKLQNGQVLWDTPGIVPDGRLSDMVCDKCTIKLIPARKLTVKLYELNKDQALVIPGLTAVECLENSANNQVILGITASDVQWQRTNKRKIKSWLSKDCEDCNITHWSNYQVKIKRNQDLIIHGLGWISARKSDFSLSLTIPKGINYSLRPNLIGPK